MFLAYKISAQKHLYEHPYEEVIIESIRFFMGAACRANLGWANPKTWKKWKEDGYVNPIWK